MNWIPPEKLCKACDTVRPMERFHAQKRGLYGKSSQCMDCQNKARNARSARSPGKSAQNMRRWRNTPGGRLKLINIKLRAAYGIEMADYDQMFAQQDGRCAICERPFVPGKYRTGERLHIDHCHKTAEATGKGPHTIRGLLCGNCNIGIGNLQDDISVLHKAIRYLEKFKP